MSGIRWAYAINQWKPQFDDFVRREYPGVLRLAVALCGGTARRARRGSTGR